MNLRGQVGTISKDAIKRFFVFSPGNSVQLSKIVWAILVVHHGEHLCEINSEIGPMVLEMSFKEKIVYIVCQYTKVSS